jgi:hypothetical protein
MSAFLGPIHHWLFSKVKLHEDLEGTLLKIYKEKYGSEINTIEETSISRYGEPAKHKPLEAQIDLTNIHQWLNSTISRTETRLAYILTEVFRKHSDAVEIAMEEFKKQGRQCGQIASGKGSTSSPAEIFKSINDYLLDGMPCDRVNFVTENTSDFVKWKTTDCLHRQYWTEVGADIDTFYKLRFAWVEAFVNSANPEFVYVYEQGDNIDSIFLHEIKRKSS